jgi:hypothetical protein
MAAAATSAVNFMVSVGCWEERVGGRKNFEGG